MTDIEDDVFLAPNITLTGTTHEVGPSTARAGAVVSALIRMGRGSWLGSG